MAPVVIETHAMRVVVTPSFGARVVSLIDKRTGRDWMAPGSESASTGEDAVYLGAEAVGWDECFPTVSPWDASRTPWQRTLRDHGDLWGRPWHVQAETETALTTGFDAKDFRFVRALEIHDAQLQATYAVENLGGSSLPWMWALHALLAVTPEDRLVLADVDQVEASFLERKGQSISPRRLPWPGPSDNVPLALDRIHPATATFAGKLYASNVARSHASIGHEGSWLEIGWLAADTPHLGLWLNYGGWPQVGPTHHIAIEPTTAPVDHLGEAIVSKTARSLEPGETHRWAVSLTLRHDPVLPTQS